MFDIFTDYDNASRISRIGFQNDVYFTVPDDVIQSLSLIHISEPTRPY